MELNFLLYYETGHLIAEELEDSTSFAKWFCN